ncbi:MAG: hypothetical protein ABSH32_22560 [Bryobacteraceae bacterium]|jgi:hypothetical protein
MKICVEVGVERSLGGFSTVPALASPGTQWAPVQAPVDRRIGANTAISPSSTES